MSDSMLRSALLVSAAIHGLFGVWVEVRGLAHAPAFREIADSWTGPGIEVDAVTVTPTHEASAAAHEASATAHEASATAHEASATVHEASATVHEASAANADAMHTASPTTRAVSTRAATPNRATHVPSPGTDAQATHMPSQGTDAPGTNATATSAASSDTPPSGAFGAQGLPMGVRHLPKAFTRALSIADRSDPRWLTLEPGPAGEARVELAVDDDGKLGELAYRSAAERDRLAPVVRHLLENTRLLLESGHFSVDPSALRAGVQRLRIRVEVVERAGASDPDGDPNELKELEYEAPTATKPGRGSFALNSGRRVIGWVYLE
jgi:hypothetical protein